MANQKVLPALATLVAGKSHRAADVVNNDTYNRDQIYVDSIVPPTPNVGMFWLCGNILKIYNGTIWIGVASVVLTWTTATRPTGAPALIGYNSDTDQYEAWSATINDWIILG